MYRYHIMYFFDNGKKFGGAVNALMQQSILMKRAGNKISIAISARDSEIDQGYQDICAVNEIEFIHLRYPIATNPENIDIVSVISDYDNVKEKIEEIKPDILHSVQINPIVELVCRELHIPHIMNIYQLMADFFSIPYINIFPYHHICDSRYFAEQWHLYLGTDSVCIRTVVNYSNNNVRRLSIKKNFINFICVGSVYRRKNQLNIIKAFHLALQKGIEGKLFIYGYVLDEYGNQCEKYVKENGLEEKIIFKGFCPDMCVEYEDKDVLICGSTMESYPNVISEALANGVIVISTPVAGVPEIIKDGYNGYICDDYSDEAICNKIMQFDREKLSGRITQILANAYDTYEKYHSPEVITGKLLEYYQNVLVNYRNIPNVSIVEIKKKFHDIIDLYNEKHDSFTKSVSVRMKLWYIYHIKDIVNKLIEEDKKFYIWGAGNYSRTVKEILEVFFPGLELRGFVDTYKEGEFCGLKISFPYDILNDTDNIVFVGILNGQEEVVHILKKYGRTCNRDYFIMAPRKW